MEKKDGNVILTEDEFKELMKRITDLETKLDESEKEASEYAGKYAKEASDRGWERENWYHEVYLRDRSTGWH